VALITIIVIALGLAMDAFAVSIVSGAAYKQLKIKHALRIALFFGGFQAIMPLIGYLAGLSIKTYIISYDHWVAFGLLSAVGGKMIYESFKIKTAEENLNPSNILILLVLSVATSIDALAIGITLSFLRVSLAAAVSIIGLVTFVLSYLGVFIGKRFGHFFENKIEAIGGLILIGLGLKILIEHLVS
jgi:putative Mn2+ efflux pump MntP